MALQGIPGDNAQMAHSILGGQVEQFLNHSKATAPRRNNCDLFLFPTMNIQLKGRRYKDTAEIPAESLRCWTATKGEFQRRYQNWGRRWVQCRNSEGDRTDQYSENAWHFFYTPVRTVSVRTSYYANPVAGCGRK